MLWRHKAVSCGLKSAQTTWEWTKMALSRYYLALVCRPTVSWFIAAHMTAIFFLPSAPDPEILFLSVIKTVKTWIHTPETTSLHHGQGRMSGVHVWPWQHHCSFRSLTDHCHVLSFLAQSTQSQKVPQLSDPLADPTYNIDVTQTQHHSYTWTIARQGLQCKKLQTTLALFRAAVCIHVNYIWTLCSCWPAADLHPSHVFWKLEKQTSQPVALFPVDVHPSL